MTSALTSALMAARRRFAASALALAAVSPAGPARAQKPAVAVDLRSFDAYTDSLYDRRSRR